MGVREGGPYNSSAVLASRRGRTACEMLGATPKGGSVRQLRANAQTPRAWAQRGSSKNKAASRRPAARLGPLPVARQWPGAQAGRREAMGEKKG